MVTQYPAIYRDEFGEETVTIENDGKTLSLVLRGREFKGKNFHSLGILDDLKEYNSFNICLGDLCGYSIDSNIPVWLISENREEQTQLHVHVEYGKCDAQNKTTCEVLQLTLVYQGQVYQSDGRNFEGTFDEQLTDLDDALPKEVYLKTCWNCIFSDYFISGSGMFGEMACFRNTKDEYLKVKSKMDLSGLWDRRAENVQEIHLCPEFRKRPLGVGGRYVGHGNMQKRG